MSHRRKESGRDSEAGKQQKSRVTKEDIIRGLREVGLESGDEAAVHSSLSSFGYVQGGPDTVIDALMEVIGPDGTLVMPTYSNNRRNLEITEEDIKSGIRTFKFQLLSFDPQKDSCWTGKIPDTFWRRKEALRNPVNTSHGLTAIGPKADVLCRGFENLLEADGKMLFLGVSLGCCSAMHLAEKRVRLPEHILKKTTPPPELAEKYHKQNIYFGYGPYPAFRRMEGPCMERGIMRKTLIGDAEVKMVKLRELIDLYAVCLEKDPDMFYVSQ